MNNLIDKVKYSKNIIYSSLSVCKHQTIIIASPGRSGSNIIFDLIVSSIAINILKPFFSKNISKYIFGRGAFNINQCKNFINGLVYKTHLEAKYFEKLNKDFNLKIIYIDRKPSDIAASVLRCLKSKNKGRDWVKSHFNNLNFDLRLVDSMNFKALNIFKHIESWHNFSKKNDNVFIIDYDNLWKKNVFIDLEIFLGFKLTNLPNKESVLQTPQNLIKIYEKQDQDYFKLSKKIENL